MRIHLPLATSAAAISVVLAGPLMAQPLPVASPESVGLSSQRLQNIDTFFTNEIALKRVPGAVVAIARNGKLVYFKAFGQADPIKGTAMATDTIFQLASMTKIQAAVGTRPAATAKQAG
jgi:CubicO group peptidase (beta-lactamase class C family)